MKILFHRSSRSISSKFTINVPTVMRVVLDAFEMTRPLAQQIGEHRNELDPNQHDTAARHELLNALTFRTMSVREQLVHGGRRQGRAPFSR